jgi:hypothetical protein
VQKNKAVLALVILSALGLGACSKNNPKSIHAQAKMAEASGDITKMGEAYHTAEKSIEKDINDVRDLGVTQMDTGVMKGIMGKIFGTSVSGENRSQAKKKLESIISKSDDQIRLAAKMGNDEFKAKAERTKTNAANLLESIQNQEDGEKADAQKDAQKTGKDQNAPASEEKNFLGF